MSKQGERSGKSKRNPKARYGAKNNVRDRTSQKLTQVKREDGKMRLNKYIANSGICSRREADMYISIGQVTVNGKVVNEMGHRVHVEDDVRFDGRRINPEAKAYVLLNKPKGFVTTTSSDKGTTVMDLVANATKSNIKPIGRLGRNATGLLLFTNDDELVQIFSNSKKGIDKLYHIELTNNLKVADMERIREGVSIDGKTAQVEEISYVDGAPKKEIGIRIKNRGHSVIRTIFEQLNYEVVRIDCVVIAGLTKRDLPRGRWRLLTAKEVINLKNG